MTHVAPLHMGEEEIGHIAHPPARSTPTSPLDRIRGRRAILSCTACDLRPSCRAPVPWSGPAPNTILVIGEAPGHHEDRQGIPFCGPSGELLRSALDRAGLASCLLTYANVVSCRPDLTPPTPRAPHITACAPNLARTLKIVAPAHVLLVGSISLTRFRPDLKITTARGRPFTVPSPCPPVGSALWCYPVIHPASVLRDRAQEYSWRRDLDRWVALLSSLTAPTFHLPVDCALCRATVDRYDPDGVAWCSTHYPKGIAGWRAAEKKRAWMLRPEILQAQSMDDIPGGSANW